MRQKNVVRILLILVLAGVWIWRELPRNGGGGGVTSVPTDAAPVDNDALLGAIRARRQGAQVDGGGRVVDYWDDTKGSRHQNFLVVVGDDVTVKVSHNVDLAPPVPAREGDTISFHGELGLGPKGAYVHWTHHDPAGRHPGGFVEYDGKRYD